MLERAFHLLSGTVRFQVRGDVSRFLNMAARSGFGFWGFSREDAAASACCKPREYLRLRPLARRCGASLRCVKKQGLPFRTAFFRKRKGMALGIFCAAGVYLFLSGFLWGVTVSGAETLGDGRILEAARRSGVYLGVRKDSFVPKVAARKIIGEEPGLDWAAVNTNGCFAEIAVREREEKPEITDDARLSNMVASRPGRVVAIEAEHGRPEVKLGDTVREGQLLISGLYREKIPLYAPPPAVLLENLGSARGRVEAETYREFTVCVSARKKELLPTGKRQKKAYLTVFGLRIPLGFFSAEEEACRTYTKRWTLTALGTELPLSLEREIREALEENVRTLNAEELQEAALLKLREAQRKELPPKARVLREELEFSFPDGMCILTAKCRCREEIGVVRPLLVNSPDFGEIF